MDILIVRDGGATKVPKTVADMAEVESLRSAGFEVEVVGGAQEAQFVNWQTATAPAEGEAVGAAEVANQMADMKAEMERATFIPPADQPEA